MVAQQDMNKKKKEGKKKPKKDLVLGDNDDEDNNKEDLEEVMEKGKQKRVTPSVASLYTKVATTCDYATTSEDRKSRMLVRQARVEKDLAEARKNIPEETEEETGQRQLESDLAR